MERTRLSNKGQVVIPHRIRAALGWKAGVEFSVEEADGTVILRPVGDASATTVDEVFGCVGYKGERKTLKQMEEGIAHRAKQRK